MKDDYNACLVAKTVDERSKKCFGYFGKDEIAIAYCSTNFCPVCCDKNVDNLH